MVAEVNRSHESGIRKAAILVASLDLSAADALLEQLAPEQSRRVRETAAALGEIDADEQQRVIDEFLRIGPMVPDQSPAGVDLGNPRMSRLPTVQNHPANLAAGSASAMGNDANSVADDAPPFGFLNETEDEQLSRLLQGERPQTIAMVLSHLPADRAGGVLAQLPSNVQVDVIRRLAALEDTDPVVLREVERSLETRLSRLFASQRRRVAGLDAVAGILEACDERMSARLLENLAACDPQLAEKLGLQTMDFDDLASLDDVTLATIFGAADPLVTQLALIGASPLLVERVLRTMPPREAKRLRKQIHHPGPLRLSDVEDARRRIAALAQQIMETSERPAFAA